METFQEKVAKRQQELTQAEETVDGSNEQEQLLREKLNDLTIEACQKAKQHQLKNLQREMALASEMATAPERRAAQHALAREVTTMVHGDAAYQRAVEASKVLFGKGDLAGFSVAEIRDIFDDVPSSEVDRARLADGGVGLLDLLTETGITTSKGEARRLIQSGGLYLNSQRIADANRHVTTEDGIDALQRA